MTAPHRKFEFGTVFGDGGHIVSTPAKEKKSFTPEEVEAIRRDAYAQGENSAIARAQMAQAAAVQQLADAAHQGLSGLNDAIQAHRRAAVELALACAQKIAAEALDRFPNEPVTAALEALGQEIELASRLVLFAASPSEEVKAAAMDAAAMAGFGGAIAFRDKPSLPKGGFEIAWSDGRAEFNPEIIFDVLHKALTEALDADAYHQARAHSAHSQG